MHFGFALELLDIDLWNIDLLETYLDLLDTGIPSKYFVCFHNFFKTSSRHVFSVTIFVFQDVLKTSSCILQDVFKDVFARRKTSLWRLGRRKIFTLKTCWKRHQDQQMFAGVNGRVQNFHIPKILEIANFNS